jgi:hypothetical protein
LIVGQGGPLLSWLAYGILGRNPLAVQICQG